MKKRVYLQILLPVLMTLIVLSVTNYFIVLSQKDYQSRVAERLLQYSERVAGQLADAIEAAESSGIAGCTPAGINLLRTIRQKNKYIDDIGIVNGNRILCTAGWGTLRSSILLSSPPYQTPSGYLLYPVRKDNFHLRNPGTVTIKHNIAVVSPALTAGLLQPECQLERLCAPQHHGGGALPGICRRKLDRLDELWQVGTGIPPLQLQFPE